MFVYCVRDIVPIPSIYKIRTFNMGFTHAILCFMYTFDTFRIYPSSYILYRRNQC